MLNLTATTVGDDTDSVGGSEVSSSNSTFSLNRTVRDYGQRINSLQRENFDLRLRIFLLEERLSVKARTEIPSPLHQYETDQQVTVCKKNTFISKTSDLYFSAGAVQGQPGPVRQAGGGGGRGDRGAGDPAGDPED